MSFDLSELAKLLGATDEADDQGWLETLEAALGSYQFSLANDPRVGVVANQLSRVEALASELANLLDNVHDNIWSAGLHPYGLGMDFDFNFPEKLAELSAGAAMARGAVTELFGSGNPDKPDTGGRGGLRTRASGTPRATLVADLAFVWAYFKREPPSGTAEGPFCQLCRLAHEVVTGEEAPSFEREIKAVAKRYRKVNLAQK